MNIHFEELTILKRQGGIESATEHLVTHLAAAGVKVTRSAANPTSLQPDCVHLHGIWSPRLAISLLKWRRRGIPCIVSPHGMLAPWALSHKWVRKRVAWKLYQKPILDLAKILHGASIQETNQFKDLGLKPRRALVPWGVDLPPVRQTHLERRPNHRTALFVGRIYPVKGLPMLLEAWARVRPQGWRLRIVGPDEAGHRVELERMAIDLGIVECIDFSGDLRGPLKDQAYEEADLFVLCSYTENFSLAVAEALAYSLPVLTTTGTPWEILAQRGCGWWIPPTADHIANHLSVATRMSDDALREMGTKGRDLVASQFSWQQAAIKLKEAYEWCVDDRETAPCILDPEEIPE